MSKSFSQYFDGDICAIMRMMENKAFLGLEMKETKSILYKYGINKYLLKFIFKFGLKINKRNGSIHKIIYRILIFLCNYKT